MMKTTLIASAILAAPSAMAQQADHSDHSMPMPQQAPAQQPSAEHDHSEHGQQPADPHAGHDMGKHDMGQMDHSQMDHEMSGMASMVSALGDYPMSRDASGTSWQPDAAEHSGLHIDVPDSDWKAMVHATIDGVYSWQDGPRGDEKLFAGGMIMGSLRGPAGPGELQLRAMLSPDPFMGKRGYPLLLAAGETADGVTLLVDRQHPHDLFMELSAGWSFRVSGADGIFVYGGLPGEPAFGLPAYMHRPAAMASPEAPITHHWFDSTHISFGVATLGWVHDDVKLEVSQFRGREPDEDRYDIETGDLDSTAVRLSWNPTPNWALQASWADVTSPEQLEPDVDVTKYSASALYVRQLEGGGEIAFTGAWARKATSEDVQLDAWLAEASWKPNADWTIFSRLEAVETDELGLTHPGPVEDVAKISLGAVRDFRLTGDVTLGLGALVSQNRVSDALAPSYDGDPMGAMAFVRLKVG